jgi:eukaryotic-like serine/threonine-protein kinase
LDAFLPEAIIRFTMAGDTHVWQPDDVIAGKYRLVRVLGEGGMGIVYEACHVRLRQRVAIKMLRPSLTTRYKVVVRFEREARAAAQLRGAHVAKVIDVDATPDGFPYIVMEFLEGRNLSQVLSESRSLPVHQVVGWVLETCCAIAEAHDLGIVHRDLKPSNLFLAVEAGRAVVKVLDFGISKLEDDSDDASLTTTTQGALGTPNYMSPEQVRSAKHVDARTDIWSIGVILYELLTGTLPFKGATSTAVGAAIVADAVPSLRELRSDLPAELEAIVIKALSKRVEDRFADVRSMAAALAPSGKLDAYLTSELAQLLAERSNRPPSQGDMNVNAGTGDAPTVPGWSQVTALPMGLQRRALFFLTLAAAAAMSWWFVQSRWPRGGAPEAAVAFGDSAAVVAAQASTKTAPLGSGAFVHDAPAGTATPSRVDATTSTSAASPPASAPLVVPKKTTPRPSKAAAPSADAPNAFPPATSGNPLHL